MNVWRIHLKPQGAHKDINQRQFCIDRKIVGVGWQIDYETVPISWEDYYKIANEYYGDNSWKVALKTIKDRIQIGDLIWTRDLVGNYFLGRIVSDWYYETDEDCAKADIVNVRKCEWCKVGTVESIPGKVVSSFRPARTLQIINEDTIKIFSQLIYNQKSRTPCYNVEKMHGKDIFALLSTDDCEDALAIFLQIECGYYIVPSSCKKDTMGYEYELIHRQNKKRAIAQVKTGWVSLNINDYLSFEEDVFLFATSGRYNGEEKQNIHTIDPEVIRNFLYENTELFPEKMKLWINLTK